MSAGTEIACEKKSAAARREAQCVLAEIPNTRSYVGLP
jgi:hypothetical protein